MNRSRAFCQCMRFPPGERASHIPVLAPHLVQNLSPSLSGAPQLVQNLAAGLPAGGADCAAGAGAAGTGATAAGAGCAGATGAAASPCTACGLFAVAFTASNVTAVVVPALIQN